MSKEYEAVQEAIRKGNISAIKKALENVKDVNEFDNDGYNLAYHLIYNLPDSQDLIDTIDILLQKGLKLDASIDAFWQNTPLLASLAYQKLNLAKYLITIDKQGVALNKRDAAKDFGENTPLLLAIKDGCEELILLLLNNGADPNLPSKFGFTSLGLAAALRLNRVIEVLIKAGAKNTPDSFGIWPWEYYTLEVKDSDRQYISYSGIYATKKIKNVLFNGVFHSLFFVEPNSLHSLLKYDDTPQKNSFADLIHELAFNECQDHRQRIFPATEINKNIAKLLLPKENVNYTLHEKCRDFMQEHTQAHQYFEKGWAVFPTSDCDKLTGCIRKKQIALDCLYGLTISDFIKKCHRREENIEQFHDPFETTQKNISPYLIGSVEDQLLTIEEIESCLTNPINKLQFMIAKLEYEMKTCDPNEKLLKAEKIEAFTELEQLILSEPQKVDIETFRKNHPKLEASPIQNAFWKPESNPISQLFDELEAWAIKRNEKKEEKTLRSQKK